MKQVRTWPSRRLQLTVIAVLVLGAALRVYWPPLTPKGRAEKLYTDSWFVGGANLFDLSRCHNRDASISLLAKALKLSPGNSLYEQALVWQYDPKKLPDLLKRRHLGPKARRLAAGRIADRAVYQSIRLPRKPDINADLREELGRLSSLQKADPTNSLIYYRKANVLQQLGRTDEALAEMKAGNRLGPTKFYYPDVSREVADSLSSPLIASPQFSTNAATRRLAMAMSDLANNRLRQGKVQEAREILESCMPMSVNVARSEPPTIISVLVGHAVFSITGAQLKPIYKDFGMKEELAGYDRLDEGFNRASGVSRAEFDPTGFQKRCSLVVGIPTVAVIASGAALALAFLTGLLWIPAWLMRRRRSQETLAVLPWGEGFLSRISVPVYLLLFAGVCAMAFLSPSRLYQDPYSFAMQSIALAMIGVVLLVQLLILALVLRVLHHRYDEHTGERTGILRFIFKAPANAKAWTRKYVMAALGAQIIFLACCFLLATIVYKPIFGGHPWQVNRFRVSYISREQAAMMPVGEDLRKAGLAFTPWEKQKK